MSLGDVAGGPQADTSDGAGAVSQAAPGTAPDGAAPVASEADAAGALGGPPPLQAATSVAMARIAPHGAARDRVRGMPTP